MWRVLSISTKICIDSNEKIYQQTDPSGIVTTFDYLWDSTVITNNNGESFYYEFYEENDEISTKTDFLGYTESYTYDDNDNITSYTDMGDNITTYEYDEMGNNTSITDPLGDEQTYEYDSTYNMMTSYTDESSNTATFEYDSNGNLTTTTDPLGNETTVTYDSNGNILTLTNALGNTTTYTYDSNGYLSTVIDPLGNITTTTYNTIGQLTSREDANDNVTSYEYDDNGNITKITDALGNETVYTYDNNNRRISTTQYDDGEPLTTLYEYDWANNVTRIIDPGDRQNTSTYGLTNYMFLSMALTTSSSNSCGSCPGSTVYYEFDEDGRLTETEDALGSVTEYTYDAAGNLAQIIDTNGNVTSYTYDDTGQLTETTYPDETTETFSYDSNGNLTSKTDRKGQTITFEYDELDRKTKKIYPDASEIEYEYDTIGRLTTITDSTGSITYSYNNASRLTQVTYPGGEAIGYAYDSVGNITQLTYPDGSTVTYTIDALNRITQIQHSGLGTIVEYIYDSIGRKTTKTLNNTTYTTYTYDDSSNLTSLINQTDDGTTISSFEYTYEPNNYNRTTMATLDGTYSYTYDDIYQLTGVTYPDSRSISYSYDNLGNRLTQDNDGTISEGTYNELNQLAQLLYNGGVAGSNITVRGSVTDANISGVTVDGVTAVITDSLFAAENVPLAEGENTVTAIATDQAGNSTETSITVILDPQTTLAYTYDNNGNMTSKDVDGETTTYIYDYDNRLTTVITSEGEVISFTYDSLGRRIEKDVDGTVTKYIYNGSQVIQETDNAGIVEATYIYGLGIDKPIVMERDGIAYYYYFDGLGSVSEVADDSGNIVEKYKYDPFGETTIYDSDGMLITESSIQNPYMYTGRRLDEETGLYYYRNRYYDPQISRFITADPIGYEGGPNLYTYARNNPVNFIDPSGTRVVVCYSDWIGFLEIGHSFVMTTQDTAYAGSWGFYPYKDDWRTLIRIIFGRWVRGKVRPYDYEYHRYELGRKLRCQTKTKDHSRDQCVYTTGWAEVARNDLKFNLYSYNCHDRRREILKRCGVGRKKPLKKYPWTLPPPFLGLSSGENINSSK